MLQEVHGELSDFEALADSLRVSHMVFGSPAASPAAGGTAMAISWSLLADSAVATHDIVEEGRAQLLRLTLLSGKELLVMNVHNF